MAISKYVYFAPDEKWFLTEKECLEYEKMQEIKNYLLTHPMTKHIFDFESVEAVTKTLLLRYEIKERWDYKQQPKEIINEVIEDYLI